MTQVLDDGVNTYTYGLGRISQTNVTTEYFLGDALGSVRQLTNVNGEITLAKSYNPYGEVTHTAGSGQSIYAYTGEQTDSTGLTYLRARYYNSNDGRFINRDTFPGYSTSSQSQNRFIYVENNPVRYTDPTGRHYSLDDFVNEAQSLINDPVQHTLDQIQKNRNLPFECTDVGQIVQWAAPALAPLIVVAAIPIILVSPDSILDLGFMAYDLAVGDYQAFYLDAMALMIPGVTGLGMLSKADEAYDGYRFINGADNQDIMIFLKNSDPLRKHGAVSSTHPKQLEKIIKEILKAGGQIDYRKGMAFNPIKGQSGKIILDPEASYGALLHEYQHFLDDMEKGNPGLEYYFKHIDEFAEMEISAYTKEIDYAKKIGDKDSVRQLIENMKERLIELGVYEG